MYKINKMRWRHQFLMGVFLISLVGCENKMGYQDKEYTQVTVNDYDMKKYYVNGANPVITADPYIIQDENGYYYAYGTSDRLNGYGFLAYKSKDLIEWEEVGTVYYTSKETWGIRDFWAPEVLKYKDQYYLHYTAKDQDGKIRIGMAVSDSAAGPFEDIKNEPFFDPGYNIIDSNILIDDEKMYLYFSRDCSENVIDNYHVSQTYVVEMNKEMDFIGEPIQLITPELSWELKSGDYRWNEAPEVIKHQDKYYLMYSGNFYNSRDYSLGYAVSDSPTGPFVKPENNRFLYVEDDWMHISGPGHHAVTTSPDENQLYAVYHTHVNPLGGGQRQLYVDKMGFREDGSLFINGPSLSPQPKPSGSGDFIYLNDQIDSIEIKGDSVSDSKLLWDDEVVYHDENSDYKFKASGKTEILINFKDRVSLTDILIYGDINQESRPEINEIIIGSHKILREIDWNAPSVPGEALIVSFEPEEVSRITIQVDNISDFAISELIFLGE